MFQKQFKLQSKNLVKGSDKKKLRDNVKRIFPTLSSEEMDLIVPLKGELYLSRVAGTQTFLYQSDVEPLFIDCTGKGDLWPTVFTLWKVPSMLPPLVIHPGVQSHLERGADLMLPGVVPSGLETLKKGQRRYVYTEGNRAAVAVGETSTGQAEITKLGMKGRAMEIIHVVGDHLWDLASKEAQEFPNIPVPIETIAPSEETASEDSTIQLSPSQSIDSAFIQSTDPIEPAIESATQENDSDSKSEISETSSTPVQVENVMSQDEILEISFLTAVKKGFPVPILVSQFYANHILPSRPPGTNLDIKKTKFKKISTFMDEKQKEGIINFKQISEGVLQIENFDKSHQSLRGFTVPEYAVKGNSTEISSKIQVYEMLKPVPPLSDLFISQGQDKTKLYAPAEARKVLSEYIEKQNLEISKNSPKINLDDTLAKILRKVHQGSEISKQDFFKMILGEMQPWHVIEKGESREVKKGNPKPIQIQTKRRQGNKHVTLISGLETFGINYEELASELRVKCASSTSVSEEHSGKNPGKVLLVQGTVIKEVSEILISEYKVPKKFIEAETPTKK